MKNQLVIKYSHFTTKGKKNINQDFHDITIPNNHLLKYKGIAAAIADGISSSNVSQIASEISVGSFLRDYYCTSESWSVKKSAQQVLTATNSWLFNQTNNSEYKYNKDKGYICTLSCLILKSNTAHIFHIGDSRVYILRDGKLSLLTKDHRVNISSQESYLSRAMGMDSLINIDYKKIPLEQDDIFILMTDGVHEFIDDKTLINKIHTANDFENVAKDIVNLALEKGSNDNLTLQIIKIDKLPNKELKEINEQIEDKQIPDLLNPRDEFDGYTIIRNISATSRSHIYLAQDNETSKAVVIKIPSIELKEDKAYLERFMLEDWIAKKINNAYVVKSFLNTRKQNYVYNVSEYIEGQTLSQWINDNPKASLEQVRRIVEQIAKGLFAFHKLEMIHQDLRPENIMIDKTGSVKVIDFGATKVAGIVDIDTFSEQNNIPGTALYSAPEYFLGQEGTQKSDIFSLGIICYQMLSGKFPYGVNIAKSTTKKSQNRLTYNSLQYSEDIKVPIWVDEAIKKAVEIEPNKRYNELSEFIYDLFNPNKKFLQKNKEPLIQKNPLLFWQSSTLILLLIIIILLIGKF